MQSFRAKLRPVPHGGHYVEVPAAVAENAGLRHGQRVRGTVNGARYRSSLMKYSGVFHLGVHKATLAAARVAPGAIVDVAIEADTEPLTTDSLPPELAAALAKSPAAAAAWKVLRPSSKREHVKGVLAAKKPETRARRIARTVAELASGAGALQTAPERARVAPRARAPKRASRPTKG